MSFVAVSIMGVGVAAQVGSGFLALNASKNAKRDADAQQRAINSILANRGEVPDFAAGMTNPYKNLQVATGAAEMQYEGVDMSLANTLDALRASGGGAGVATALAQQAQASKGQISATIEQQEAANQQLRAKGQADLERMQAQSREAQFGYQEDRTNMELDRAAGLKDRYLNQAAAQRQSAFSSFAGVGSDVMQFASGLTTQ